MSNVIKPFAGAMLGTYASLALIGGLKRYEKNKYEKSHLPQMQKEIKLLDSAKYLNILEDINAGTKRNTYTVWAEEAAKLRDSIRIDSIAKKAYYEGAQMVRDSIKAASR